MHALGILLAALPCTPQPAHDGPWAIDSDRGSLIVTQSASVEWPGPAGEPAEKPELVLRCAGGEKDVYLYYSYGFPSKDGDLFVQFEGDTAKPKKKEPLPEVRFDLAGLDAALGEWLKECPLKVK